MPNNKDWKPEPMTTADHIKNALHSIEQARAGASSQAGEALSKAATWLDAALVHSPEPTGPDPKKDPPPPLERERAE